MKKALKFLIAGFIMLTGLFPSSCSKDDSFTPTPSPDDKLVPVVLNIVPEEMTHARAIDENIIRDVNLYFFGSSENYHFYYDRATTSFTLQLLPGRYQLYVVTNVHEDMGEKTRQELSSFEYAVGDMTADILMTATQSINITGATTLPALQVRRIAAKISYNIIVDDAVTANIKLRSVQFCNLPKTVTPFGGSERPSTDKNDFYDADPITISSDKTYSGVTYMFANSQGTVSSITDQKDKSPENAPECATYMRIFAEGPGKILEYIVYLGENNTSSFNVRRNTKHEMNLYIEGEDVIDNRVMVYDGLYYGEANCYICTGTQLRFDTAPYRATKNPAYTYSDVYAGDEYKAAKIDVLWQDQKLLIQSVYFNADKRSATLKTSGRKGNAVIALYNKAGEIIWTFHIWCTAQPQNLDFASNSLGHAYSVMDRNLGAMSAELGVDSSFGLYYQWGRKDPFIGFTSPDYVNDKEMYDMDGKEVTLTKKNVGTTPVNSEEMTKNPLTFYVGIDPWDNSDASKTLLWGDNIDDGTAPVKTIYDPCPKGYMVAPHDLLWITHKGGNSPASATDPSAYYTYGNTDIESINKNGGWALYCDGNGLDQSKIFYFNFTGSRNILASGVGIGGNIWSSGCSSDYNAHYNGCGWSALNFDHSTTNHKTGYPVRCVRIDSDAM